MTNQTYGEQFDSACRCETKEQAEEWMEAQVQSHIEPGQTVEFVIEVIKQNLGYMAGYCDDKTAAKIKWLFNADHPGYGKHQP